MNKVKNKNTSLVQCVWGLVCGLSSIDQENNNISLFNVIDEIGIPKNNFSKKNDIKKVLFNHEIIFLCRRSLSLAIDNSQFNCDYKVKLFDSSGSVIQEIVAPLIFEKNKRNMRLRVRFNVLLFTAPGDYVYTIEIQKSDKTNFQKEFEIPFEIKSI